MKITIQAENKAEQKIIGFKEVDYKGITDYYLDVRWVEGKIVQKDESRSYGDALYLIGRLYSALFQLKESWKNYKNGSSK
jgi:hypothetical protein